MPLPPGPVRRRVRFHPRSRPPQIPPHHAPSGRFPSCWGSGGGRLFLLHRCFLHSGVTSLGRHIIQAEVVIDALDLGGVICKHHHLDAFRLLPVPNGDVQQPVFLGFPGKFLHITHRHLKEFEGGAAPANIRTSRVLPRVSSDPLIPHRRTAQNSLPPAPTA